MAVSLCPDYPQTRQTRLAFDNDLRPVSNPHAPSGGWDLGGAGCVLLRGFHEFLPWGNGFWLDDSRGSLPETSVKGVDGGSISMLAVRVG